MHPSQVRTRKRELVEGAGGIFASDNAEQKKNDEALVERLYQRIGQLKVEKDLLEGNLGR